MSYLGTADGRVLAGPKLSVEALRGGLLWLMGFAGAFVFIEPSPYEIVALVGIFLFAVTGLSLSAALMPLVLLLIFLNIGYAMAVVQVVDDDKAVTWVYVSAFMAATAIAYAGVLSHNTGPRVNRLLGGYIAAAAVAALVGVAAYFHLLGSASDLFLLYGRARGTFNDPNVLGAFLVLPGIVLFGRILNGRASEIIRNGILMLAILAGLLLTFSRGAWGQFAFAAVIVMALNFMTSRSAGQRVRIILVAALGVLVGVIFIAALLSIPQVADIFGERATLDQSYDVGHFGRFGRYILGAELGLERPFGIGPLQFWRLFGEDPHNTYLNTFMSGGWLSGLAYLTLTAVTLTNATRFVRAPTPWQSTYHAVYAAYLGVSLESAIIDIDHWRHYFLILGALWGLMVASRPYLGGDLSRSPQ
jgi:O-antigen ligase